MASKRKVVARKSLLTTLPSRLLEKVRKELGPTSAYLMAEGLPTAIDEVCPTGMAVLDRHVLGIGGLPYRRIVEVYGDESSGKTTLLNVLIAAVQRDGGVASLADAENKFDPAWARLHGVDPDRVLLSSPTLEDWFQASEVMVNALPANGKLLLGLDSVAAIPTKREVEEGLSGDALVGEHSRIWSSKLRTFSRLISSKKVIVVLINQTRMKIGVMYGNPETTPGGRAIPYYALTRLRVSHGKTIKDGTRETGRYIHISASKCQTGQPHRRVALKLDYEFGLDDDWSVFNHAKDAKVIPEGAPYIPKNVREAYEKLGWPPPATPPLELTEEEQQALAAEAAGQPQGHDASDEEGPADAAE